MNSEFDPYIQKLRHYKELYLIDEEAYGDWPDKKMEEMKEILDDFVRYVELSSIPKPSQQGNWCNPEGDNIVDRLDNFLNFKHYGF
jgi:hypothetical protein